VLSLPLGVKTVVKFDQDLTVAALEALGEKRGRSRGGGKMHVQEKELLIRGMEETLSKVIFATIRSQLLFLGGNCRLLPHLFHTSEFLMVIVFVRHPFFPSGRESCLVLQDNLTEIPCLDYAD